MNYSKWGCLGYMHLRIDPRCVREPYRLVLVNKWLAFTLTRDGMALQRVIAIAED